MRLLLVSNGHGEDLSGAWVGAALQRQGTEVLALPLVGDGGAYRNAGLSVAGRTRSYSTGGLGYASFAGRAAEILQGQVFYLLRRSWRVWREARHADGLVVIGDVIPVLLAWLTSKPVVTYLVAYSSHYEGRLRLPWPCGPCLASRRFKTVFSRDALTASDLTEQLQRTVQFLGNPFMESIAAADGITERDSVLLLPGSRLPEASKNLEQMLALLEQLPTELHQLNFQAALVKDFSATQISTLALARGWTVGSDRTSSDQLLLRLHELQLRCCWGQFQALLPKSKVVISMAGTATEQAVGLGIPVLQMAGHGPQFTTGFAEAQRRLLGPAVHCAAGEVDDPATLKASAALLQKLLALPIKALELYRTEGLQRLGASGGTGRMAQAILDSVRPH